MQNRFDSFSYIAGKSVHWEEAEGKKSKLIKKLRVVSILPFFVPSLLGFHHDSQTPSFKVAFPHPFPYTAAKHTHEQTGYFENVNQIFKTWLEWFLIFLLQ